MDKHFHGVVFHVVSILPSCGIQRYESVKDDGCPLVPSSGRYCIDRKLNRLGHISLVITLDAFVPRKNGSTSYTEYLCRGVSSDLTLIVDQNSDTC